MKKKDKPGLKKPVNTVAGAIRILDSIITGSN
jgi:hypothetical protein